MDQFIWIANEIAFFRGILPIKAIRSIFYRIALVQFGVFLLGNPKIVSIGKVALVRNKLDRYFLAESYPWLGRT